MDEKSTAEVGICSLKPAIYKIKSESLSNLDTNDENFLLVLDALAKRKLENEKSLDRYHLKKFTINERIWVSKSAFFEQGTFHYFIKTPISSQHFLSFSLRPEGFELYEKGKTDGNLYKFVFLAR
ncbi:hypothetical protein GCM10007877_09020 [Marinibactrum halimedae]|uniref:Uncharacterized protein n=2 Tax=Marinibactrum halimedae TaxID=1444977 RepID=A0AA37WKQ0_9GAMM|nr:hypothetical protein GCM10007877_09020 [Marinibactrum halimedae]